jgi:predicted esterase
LAGAAFVASSGQVREAAARDAPALTRRIAPAKPSAEAAARSLPPLPSGPVYLNDAHGTPNVLVYPARRASSAPRPPAVMLHGMCDEPEWECPHFAAATAEHAFLVCPRANLRCDGGGSIWSGDGRSSAAIEASVSRAAAEYPEYIDAVGGRTLIGFSLGAIRAVELANSGNGKWRSVIAIGAKVHPRADRLCQAGVERVVLAAGDHDMMKWHMVGEAKRLARAGFPVAFMSMGKVGHTFPKDIEARMRRALAWADGDDAAFVPLEKGELVFTPEHR